MATTEAMLGIDTPVSIGQRLSEAAVITDLDGTELMPVIDDPGVPGGNKVITTANVVASTIMDAAISAALTTEGAALFDTLGAAAEAAAVAAAETAALDTRLDVIESGGIVNQTLTAVTVVNTTTETTILTRSLPAQRVGANDAALLRFVADCKNNSGGAATLTLRVKFGAVTLCTTQAMSYSDSALRTPLIGEITFDVIDFDSMITSMLLFGGSAAATQVAPLLNTNHSGIYVERSDGVAAFGSATSIVVTAQWSVANALTDVTLYVARLGAIQGV
jgi:hypothetical protein